MRRIAMAVVGALGLGALWRRRRHGKPEALPAAAEPDPAEELRAKLAATKTSEPEAVTDSGAEEPIAPESNGSPMDPEVRRRSVHERARASMDDLK